MADLRRMALPACDVRVLPGDRLGRAARHPAQIPWPGWRAVLVRTGRELVSDRVSLVAAGCAFWGVLALFPAISMLISIYGLVFNPHSVLAQLAGLRDWLPGPLFGMISARVHLLVGRPAHTIGLRVAISAVVTLWTSALGTKSLLQALNLAYRENERRGLLRLQALSLGMTLCGLLAAAGALALLVLLPAAVAWFGLWRHRSVLIAAGSNVMLVVFVLLALSVLYRFGPCRRAARWVWVTPGSAVATLIWLVATHLYSWYLSHIAIYDVLYGSLGAVAGILMWFWVTAYAVLLGAELNSELEMQTALDTTSGAERAAGLRGAFVADHVARE